MKREKELQAFARLLDVMDDLREKCPWDRKQTMDSLRPNTIEETYELADAILAHDMHNIAKELGDLLLHIVFYAKIGSETGEELSAVGDIILGVVYQGVARSFGLSEDKHMVLLTGTHKISLVVGW